MASAEDIEEITFPCKHANYTAERGDNSHFALDTHDCCVYISVMEDSTENSVKIDKGDISNLIIWLASVLDAEPAKTETEEEDGCPF